MTTKLTREDAGNPAPRTLEQVREALTRIKAKSKDGADKTMARMMLTHGRLTDEARAFVAEWK